MPKDGLLKATVVENINAGTQTPIKNNIEERTIVGGNPMAPAADALIQYREIIELSNLEAGLERIRDNVFLGVDGEVKSDINLSRLQKLHEELASHKYQPTPGKKVQIPKPDGGTRSLGIASQIDKVVRCNTC